MIDIAAVELFEENWRVCGVRKVWHQLGRAGFDARRASGGLTMMPNKTDRHDVRDLAQIVRTGWFKTAQIESHAAYVNRAMLTAREALVDMGEVDFEPKLIRRDNIDVA